MNDARWPAVALSAEATVTDPCVGWPMKANGKPDAAGAPVDVPRGERVFVEAVILDVQPRTLLVRRADGTKLELREGFLV